MIINPADTNIIIIDYVIFANDLREELIARGFKVKKILVAMLNVDRFLKICNEFKPSMIISVNFSPEIALLASIQEIPYISWTVDPLPLKRFQLFRGTKTELCTAFVHRKNNLTNFETIGIKDAAYLPLAAPGGRRKAITDQTILQKYHCNISFVGNSLQKENEALITFLKNNKWELATIGSLNQALKEYFLNYGDLNSFSGLEDSLDNFPSELKEKLLNCQNKKRLTDLLNGALSAILRQERVRMLQDQNIHIYGDKGWKSITKNYKGFADHGDELTSIYSASTINLDLPRIYQRDILTMRIFDILACGGILLTENSDNLPEIFSNGIHLMSYTDSEDMLEKTNLLIKDDSLREAISKQGMEEVLNHHLISHRVDTILQKFQTKYTLQK